MSAASIKTTTDCKLYLFSPKEVIVITILINIATVLTPTETAVNGYVESMTGVRNSNGDPIVSESGPDKISSTYPKITNPTAPVRKYSVFISRYCIIHNGCIMYIMRQYILGCFVRFKIKFFISVRELCVFSITFL